MILDVRDINQNSLKVCVKISDTILRVKEKIKSKIEIIEIDDQTLVYSGNILADNKTVRECGIDENDYLTLIYSQSIKKDEICKMLEEQSEKGSKFQLDASQDKNDDTIDAIGEVEWNSDVSQINDSSGDHELEDLSRQSLLQTTPDVRELWKIAANDPVALSKHLSKLGRQRPSVLERILENQHAYIDSMNMDECDGVGNECNVVESKDLESINRLLAKGYGKEITIQVYQACDFNESDASELLNYLH